MEVPVGCSLPGCARRLSKHRRYPLAVVYDEMRIGWFSSILDCTRIIWLSLVCCCFIEGPYAGLVTSRMIRVEAGDAIFARYTAVVSHAAWSRH